MLQLNLEIRYSKSSCGKTVSLRDCFLLKTELTLQKSAVYRKSCTASSIQDMPPYRYILQCTEAKKKHKSAWSGNMKQTRLQTFAMSSKIGKAHALEVPAPGVLSWIKAVSVVCEVNHMHCQDFCYTGSTVPCC